MNPCYWAASSSLIALALLQVLWYGLLAPATSIPASAAIALALLPFALPLLGATRDPRTGLLLGALVALLYFCHGVMEAWANPAARLLAVLEIILSMLVIALAGWPSWQQGLRKRRNQCRG